MRQVYMDSHATTPVDPRVVEAMAPCWTTEFGNPGSVSHAFGWRAQELVDQARETIAGGLNIDPKEVVFTSGATESNNLAIFGVAQRATQPGHIVSVATEHKALLDPLGVLARRGWDVTLLPVASYQADVPGVVDLAQLDGCLREDTALVSVMLANNEIGVLQPVREIAAICRDRNIPLHTDATQAVGKLPVDLARLDADMISFSGHKMYGPKGVGALVIRRRRPRVRLTPQIVGGGQERGFRSGTLNVPGIVGLAAALRLCLDEMPEESARLRELRNQLAGGLKSKLPDAIINGPPLDPQWRLDANLNCSFPGVDGEALMMNMPDLAVSSGSACTSANPEPSHVLRELGLSDDLTRASLRFGLGRFNTAEDVEFACEAVATAVQRLRSLA